MRVVTWNILACRGWMRGESPASNPEPQRPWVCTAMVEALAELEPDLIALQECPSRSIVEDMAARLGFYCAWFPARWAGDAVWLGGFPGALLSRYPLRNIRNELDHQEVDAACFQRHWGSSVIDFDGLPLTIHAYHCCADFGGKIHTAVRSKELATLLRAVADTTPCMLLGDHNCLPGAAPLQQLTAAGFSDAHAIAGQGMGYSDPADAPFQRIDQCWLRGLHASACFVPDQPAFSGDQQGIALSDHRPVVVDIAVP